MHARVLESRQLTPHLVRVVLGDGDLDRFTMVEATDAYVNLAFPPADAPYDAVFEPAAVREQHPKEVLAGPAPLHRGRLGRRDPPADARLRGARRRRRGRRLGDARAAG